MKSIEEFYGQNLTSAARSICSSGKAATLPTLVRQAANRGWHIFPVSPLAKLAGNPDLLISEATNDVDLLAESAAKCPGCSWRVAAGASSLCILQLNGPEGSHSFSSFSKEDGECLTLQARRGDTAWGFFLWPEGLALRNSAKKLAQGMRILGRNDSCVIPPTDGSFYINPWAEVETVPSWLRELAFETPDSPAARALPALACSSNVPGHSPRTRFEEPRTRVAKTHSFRNQAGRQTGFRISCRR